MLCLGVESTAHTFGIGLVSDSGRVLSNVKETYAPPKGWGIKPADAARHHREVAGTVLEKALQEAGTDISDINLIAFSQGPGLPPCLHEGLNFSAELGRTHSIPVIGVNHCIAHIEISRLLTKARDPIILYVSGGNTQVLSFLSGRYRCFGESMDIGIGNALDKFGREAGLEFPAGPKIEGFAKKIEERRKQGKTEGTFVALPYTVKGMDLSFSGIVTEALRKLKQGESLEVMCFSLQETLFSMLVEVTERALAHVRKDECIVTGGVAANSRLREMLSIMCRERGAKFYSVPQEFAGDNGAMIAWTGVLAYHSGQRPEKSPEIKPRQRTDEVDVRWLE